MPDYWYLFLKWVIIAMPGFMNFSQAYFSFFQEPKIKGFPFFKPFYSPGFLVWSAFQLSFPCLLFLALFKGDLADPSQLNFWIFLKSVLFGINFVGLTNATTNFGPKIVDFKSLYKLMIKLVDWSISAEQGPRSRAFWLDFREELRKCSPEQLLKGLDYLQECFRDRESQLSNKLAKVTHEIEAEGLSTSISGGSLEEVQQLIECVNRLAKNKRSSILLFRASREEDLEMKVVESIKGKISPSELRNIAERFGLQELIDKYQDLP